MTLIIKKIIRSITTINLYIAIFACAKLVSVSPPKTQLTTPTVFENSSTANAAVVQIYSYMANFTYNTSLLCGLSSDEFVDYSGQPYNIEFYTNSLTPPNENLLSEIWSPYYQTIYYCNSVIEGLNKSTAIPVDIKNQYTGEAMFSRAFCYFYLTNLFGDVPLVLSTDYQLNATLARTSNEQVYNQIISDLKLAETLLPVSYNTNNGYSGDRTRPNKSAAAALLARVYLYTSDWKDAKLECDSVIDNTSTYLLESDLNNVFLKSSKEAIWQLQPVQIDYGYNTLEGSVFILTSTPYVVALDSSILGTFETNDLRRQNWINSYFDGVNNYYFPYKYKIQVSSTLTEYSMVLRLAEQYLIRAEAEAQSGDFTSAQNDINIIRARAGLPGISVNTLNEMLDTIAHERRVELFTEWGDRWLNLKRTGQSQNILNPIKSPNWQSTDTLYPIPQYDLLNDHNLTQNTGY